MKTLTIISAMALNTFRETVRDRVLLAIIVFALIATVGGMVLGTLSVGQDSRIMVDLGLFAISAFGGLIAVFVGTNLVFKEIDRRTIYLLFTKPIQRWHFIVGKFLGLGLCLFVVCIAMGAFLSILVVTMAPGGTIPLSGIFVSLAFMYVELLLVVAMAIFFSTFATPLMSMLFTVMLWMCGHLSQSLLNLGKMSESASVKLMTEIVYYILPDLGSLTQMRWEILNQSALAGTPEKIAAAGLAAAGADPLAAGFSVVAYVIVYCIGLLALSTVITQMREFQ